MRFCRSTNVKPAPSSRRNRSISRRIAASRSRSLYVSASCRPQLARAPTFEAAHLGVEVARERILDRYQQGEVRPPQLSQQCCDNWPFGKHLGELHHPAEVLLAKTAAVLCFEPPSRGRDEPRAIVGATALQDLGPDAGAELPVQRGQRGVRGNRDVSPRGLDHVAEVAHEDPEVETCGACARSTREANRP